MTTEVLRNMLYERSDTLDGLVTVVMDEVHYLQDPYRGAVWEEVLIHLPRSVAVVCLSATISNAEEFGEWIGTLRGETRVVIEERRPVPLEHHYLVGRRAAPDARRAGRRAAAEPVRGLARPAGAPREGLPPAWRGDAIQTQRTPPARGHRGVYVPRREEVVEVLARGRDAAGDLLRVQPGGLRPERAVAPRRRASGSPRARRPSGSASAPRGAPRGSTRRTS